VLPLKFSKLFFLTLLLVLMQTAGWAKTIKASVAVSVKNPHNTTKKQLLCNATYKSGLVFFNKKDYAAALGCFQLLDGDGFCCDTIHYYIGQCYQNTNQTVAAQQHYDWVVQRSKDPTLRSYADYANRTIAYYSSHRTYAGQGNVFGSSAGSYSAPPRRIGFS
jgi:hypothetical protein